MTTRPNVIERILMATDLEVGEALREAWELQRGPSKPIPVRCQYGQICPDIAALTKDPSNEELIEQYYGQCNSASQDRCSQHQAFEKKYGSKR